MTPYSGIESILEVYEGSRNANLSASDCVFGWMQNEASFMSDLKPSRKE